MAKMVSPTSVGLLRHAWENILRRKLSSPQSHSSVAYITSGNVLQGIQEATDAVSGVTAVQDPCELRDTGVKTQHTTQQVSLPIAVHAFSGTLASQQPVHHQTPAAVTNPSNPSLRQQPLRPVHVGSTIPPQRQGFASRIWDIAAAAGRKLGFTPSPLSTRASRTAQALDSLGCSDDPCDGNSAYPGSALLEEAEVDRQQIAFEDTILSFCEAGWSWKRTLPMRTRLSAAVQIPDYESDSDSEILTPTAFQCSLTVPRVGPTAVAMCHPAALRAPGYDSDSDSASEILTPTVYQWSLTVPMLAPFRSIAAIAAC